MAAPAVSVVMPVRNASGSLRSALASLAAQTMSDWELVAAPDRCEDDTVGILTRAAQDDSRIRLIGSFGAGLVPALNACLAAARAPLIARFDADDICGPTRLTKQAAFLHANPLMGACGSLVNFGGDTKAQQGYALHVEWINSLVTPEAISLNRFIESPLAHPSVMFRTRLAADLGGYLDSPWPEDYELWLRWLDAGISIGKVPETLLTWNDPPDRLSRTDPRYSPGAFYACKCHFLALWLRRERPGATRVLLWGAGRPTRRRFAPLAGEGIALAGYIDVDPKKIGGRADGLDVIGPDDLPEPTDGVFVIVGVGTRGARDLIRTALLSRGYNEGIHFLCAA